ncbi:MerR family transcriptional regulator [Paenibacillus sacheonensis]|uniref:MerR family transcriptional regulator n=1 Tax=Paenibacillus sacheonensis TaxID=742054 RepID=A0A7X5BZC1_9BACL|nr:MerR family transcriptional regulator [Paenibacillus sacheonensis]MBM7566123.1 DNA-binding transcriptional MerR regulator [Paenibacillus sacheonensis]NBC70336.1 MerR family transcriptional regulator [Paenibacillus sacheonensis]
MYTIGQAAELAGFSIDTLRYYEKIGLTKPPMRKPGGLRLYSEDDVRLLSSLHCLKKTGLSLEEMKAFLQEGRCFANPAFPLSDEDREAIAGRTQILAKHLARMEAEYLALANVIGQTREKLDFYDKILKMEAAVK